MAHGLSISLLMLIYVLSFVLNKENATLNFYLGVIWCLLFTFAIAHIRMYTKEIIQTGVVPSSLFAPVASRCVFLAVLLTAGMAILSLPIFWGQLYGADVLARKNTTLVHSLSKHLASNFVVNITFIVCWSSVYISFVSFTYAKNSEIERLKLEKNFSLAQLENLNHQLNPHFLFNALNNIRFLIHENPERADDALTILSELLRSALEVNKSKTIPLHQEMSVVNQYLEIMKIQLEQRLKLEISMEQEVANALVPPMCIQLLVENAIKHGIDKINVPSLLSIKIAQQDGQLSIAVENLKPVVSEVSVSSTGTGLANLQERLLLLYGPTSSLVVDSNEMRFNVTLVFPVEELS